MNCSTYYFFYRTSETTDQMQKQTMTENAYNVVDIWPIHKEDVQASTSKQDSPI
jgi:hypothetical protein